MEITLCRVVLGAQVVNCHTTRKCGKRDGTIGPEKVSGELFDDGVDSTDNTIDNSLSYLLINKSKRRQSE